jgi:plastocyanin
MKLIVILSVTVLLFLAVCGCTQQAAPSQPATSVPMPATLSSQRTIMSTPLPQTSASVSDNTVSIRDNAFIPANITVNAGETVRWVNDDPGPHRIQFTDSHYATVLIGASQSASQRFDQPGVFEYTCLIHPEMHGTVTVV